MCELLSRSPRSRVGRDVLHGPVGTLGTIGAAEESLVGSIPVVWGGFVSWYRQLRIKQKPYITVFMGM